MTSGPRVVRAPHPPHLDHPDAWAYKGRADVEVEAELATFGHDDLVFPADQILVIQGNQRYARRAVLVAVDPAATADPPRPRDVVGFASYAMPLTDNTHLLDATLTVRPGRKDGAVHDALLAAVERDAAEAGRRTVGLATDHAPEPPPGPGAIEAPTGSGRVPADDPTVRAALRAGFTLRQVERYSVLTLPVDTGLLGRLHAEAAEHAGDEYRTHVWDDVVPDEWIDQVAHLQQRMSTDIPHGDLEVSEEAWDAERYRSLIDEQHARGNVFRMAVAEHVPSGTLAGFTIVVGPATDQFAFQEDTLVLSEHRGRRLGMLMKAANLLALQADRPGMTRIHTWNAEENGPMLDINVALGFRGAGVCALWEKPLASSGG
ncbi:hypothetical protein SAMN04489860_0746 [Paraoerskovia marina]|uniref:Acetyltransferase (GNAT) family protein n=1 Tax=Paraoerskovia marina TaxID=545619 RepID=A0A1H1P9L3_9CELL|nr:hypothetical protein [Paraoerskovia marina]SDS07968.1 hypothetical protein SAMN04489860_0746 [Paraoerskovia marina]